MLTYNDQTKTRFPLSLDGRGARGEGALLILSSFLFYLFSAPAALAQDECGAQTDPGNPETIVCDPDVDYPTGITYSSDGSLTLELPVGSAGDIEILDGVSVTGNGGDDIAWDSTAFQDRIRGALGGTGAVIDYLSDTGNITVEVGGANSGRGINGMEYAIRAESTGGGDIAVTTGGYAIVDNTTGDTAIFTQTTGGNIVINANIGGSSSSTDGIHAAAGGGNISITAIGDVDGTARGIYAETSGSGAIEIDTTNTLGGNRSVSGSDVGVEARAGGGDIQLDIGNVSGGTGIVTDTLGSTTINILEELDGVGGTAIVSTGAQVLVNFDAGTRIGFGSGSSHQGLIDFTGVTGSSEIHVGGEWNTTGDSADEGQTAFGAGDDLINILPGGGVTTGNINDADSDALDPVTEIDFGGGENAIVNAGVLRVGVGRDAVTSTEAQTIFSNLDTFDNAGMIVMGFRGGSTPDRVPDDVLTMLGATFTGTGDSRIVMHVDLNAVGQTNCIDRLADGDLVAADCVDLRNGEAAGQTAIVLGEVFPGDRGVYNPDGNVLIDVNGGTGTADAFYLHPDSDNYSPAFGGVIDKGFFIYPLAYDDTTQQYKLFGVPGGSALQLPLLAHAAQSLWRTSAVSRFDRQRNLDAALHSNVDNPNKGVWFRLSTESGERDVTQSVIAGIETLDFDNGYTQDSSALTMGLDFIQKGSWVVGGQVGYVTSTLEYDASPNDVNFEGMSVGLYSSLFIGDFFVDALVNGNWLQLDNDVPSLNLFPEGTILSSDVKSYGAQIEAGWSGFSFGRLGIEPLANLSYVLSDFDTVEVPADDPIRLGSNVKYDDPVSFRGGLGVRLSADDVIPGFIPTSVSLTTRVVNEFDGESKVLIENVGPIDAPAVNEFEGTFTEVSGSVTVSNTAKTVAGYLNVDGTFESDYESLGASLGIRYQW